MHASGERPVGSPFPLLSRLAGLETEYAIRYQVRNGEARPTDHEIYIRFLRELARETPTAEAKHIKEGVFLANGGAAWFEKVQYAGGHGLIEGATPECRGPLQTITFQRAQDELLSEAISRCASRDEVSLIKNDRDSQDNIYGAQENYEVGIERGLWLWRAGLVLLIPCVLLCCVANVGLLIVFLTYLVLAGVVSLLILPFLPVQRRSRFLLTVFGGDLTGEDPANPPIPRWMEELSVWWFRVSVAPAAIFMWILARWVAYRRYVSLLTPFFVSRVVIAGSGLVDQQNRFQLADKAPAMNCLFGFSGLVGDRPIFNIGHLLKAVCIDFYFQWREFRELFAPRQRLQICIGDSNMCEEAEYLRVGTTMLLLDAIEAGFLTAGPSMRRPLRNLRQIVADPDLTVRVKLAGGKTATALELQRFYLGVCRRFVEQCDNPGDEARDLLRRWDQVLTALESCPQELVGRIDWVTKRFLLEQAAEGADYEVRKKIDIRYHELSNDGYLQQLKQTGLVARVVDPAAVEQARRTPPPNTPAATRGRYIREFSDGPDELRVNWRAVVFGYGWRSRKIRLSDYGKSARD